jgi:hypothetical protein
MSNEIDDLKAENERLHNRVKMLEAPFELENASIVSVDIEGLVEDIMSVRIARINGCEFINGGLYMSLISKHFKEVHDSIVTRMIANRMAESIEIAKAEGVATANMIDGLTEWNNMMGVNQEVNQAPPPQ